MCDNVRNRFSWSCLCECIRAKVDSFGSREGIRCPESTKIETFRIRNEVNKRVYVQRATPASKTRSVQNLFNMPLNVHLKP